MSDKLRVFVASSSEQIDAAKVVADALSVVPELDVHVWKEDVFEFSNTYIESLEKELDRADFAVVVLTADDSGNVREKKVNLPRDNVIFELGLFVGRLGRPRCFFFVDSDSHTKIASDLSGVKLVNFYRKANSADLNKPSLEAQASKVQAQVLALGPRYKASPKVRDGQKALWSFSRRFAGHYWERMRKGQDDKSALSYLTVTVDEIARSPRIEGKTYGKDSNTLADWKTVVTGVVLEEKPLVYYRWEGTHEAALGQLYGGGGRIVFDDHSLETACGYFYDTNFAMITDGEVTRIKHFGLYRCSVDDIEKMKSPWSDEANALIRHRLATLRGR